MPSSVRLLPLLLLASCADITPIENGRAYGPVVALQDFFTSCHLLRAGDAVVLIDACWRPDELANRLREHDLTPADVTHVLFTHGHADHVGGLAALTNALVLALPPEQPVLTEHAEGADATIDQALADGEELTFGSTTVRVYAMPGHTPGSAAFLVDGTLVMGDTALITASGRLAPAPEDRSEDPAGAVAALVALDARLASEGRTVEWLLPAHSGGVAGRQALADFAAAER